jgi:hypothetical protein
MSFEVGKFYLRIYNSNGTQEIMGKYIGTRLDSEGNTVYRFNLETIEPSGRSTIPKEISTKELEANPSTFRKLKSTDTVKKTINSLLNIYNSSSSSSSSSSAIGGRRASKSKKQTKQKKQKKQRKQRKTRKN